jgi:4-azaleucine resistance transporter AzlC
LALHRDLRRGYIALLALWPGVVSIGLAYAVVSLDAGLNAIEIQLFSLLVYSGAGQFAISSLVEEDASVLAIIATIAVLGLRHVLYGLSASRWLPREGQPPKPVVAHFLVDESYGFAEAEVASGRANGWFLLGAGLSLFTAWNVATAAGLMLSQVVDFPSSGLDFIFPLSFVAITIPLIKHRRHLFAAVLAVAVTVSLSQIAGAGLTIFVATIAAVALAAIIEPANA